MQKKKRNTALSYDFAGKALPLCTWWPVLWTTLEGSELGRRGKSWILRDPILR